MSLRLVIGASGAGKSTQLYREIIDRSSKDPDGKFFIIVPDQFTMQTQQDLVTMHERKGIMNIDVLSFSRLAHRIFEEVGTRDVQMLDDTGKSLIIRKVASGLREQMPVIGGNLNKTGYVHEVKSALSEFMQYGIKQEELKELEKFSEKRGQLYHKLKDLEVIYGGFLSYIHEKFQTVEELLETLASLIPSSALIRNSVIAIDGFTGFTPVQNKVLAQLLACASEVLVTVTLDGREADFSGGEQELFALSKKTVRSLLSLAKETGTDRGEDVILNPTVMPRFAQNPQLAHLERHLFRYPVKPFKTPAPEMGNDAGGKAADGPCGIRIMEASTQTEEVRQICIAIRRLVREQDYCYRDIAVICGDFNAYASCMEREAAVYGIPVYMDHTRGIVLNPFIEFIKSALKIRVMNYSFESVFHYLRSGLADFTPEETDRLENYVRAAGIRGRKKWETMFVRRTPEMLEGPKELDELNALRERLVTRMEPLYGKYEKTKEFAQGLYRFIEQSRVQQKLKRFEDKFRQQGDPVRAKEYAQIYRLVMDLLDQVVELIGEEKSRPEEFAKILEAGFEEIKVGTIPQNVDRVVIGDMERTRLKQVKALFIAGVNEGYIPGASGKGGILSDLDREFLTGCKVELSPSPRQQMYIQKLYLYMNMTKPSQQLTLSYSRMNAEGKTMRPSFLIAQVKKLFSSVSVSIPEKEPVLEQIQTWGDGRDYLARGMREYADGVHDSSGIELFFTLYRLYSQKEEYKAFAEKLADTAFYTYRESPLGRAVAAALYGQTLSGSVSRLEQYAACAYAHFLRYGLKLKEQGEFTFEAADLGNIFHDVLEIFADKLKESDYTWFDFPKEVGERLVEEAVDAFTVTYHNTVLFDSARNAFMITRVKRILKRTVNAMQYQLKQGSFVPEQFEVSFSVLEELDAVNIALSEKEKMRLRGRIDRMDVREDEKHVYVKVVDYKSGSRQFSLAALYYGLQLQLVVYLNAAMEIAAKKHPDKEVVPAAMLYYRVHDPFIDTSEELSEEEINLRILKALRTTGVVNGDEAVVAGLDNGFSGRSDVIPVERRKDGSFGARSNVMGKEDFRIVSDYVNRKIRQAGTDILDGRIALDPYVQGNKSACDYCPYGKVCSFDRKVDGYDLRELKLLKEDEALAKIREEVYMEDSAPEV